MSISKRVKAYREKVDPMKVYNVTEAIDIVKSCATAKFNENIDVCVNLGVNAKQSDQNVRGAVVLPHGTGKVVRVAVFAQGDNAKKAQDAADDMKKKDVEKFASTKHKGLPKKVEQALREKIRTMVEDYVETCGYKFSATNLVLSYPLN